VTRRPQAFEHVYAVEVRVVVLDAVIGVQGEDEGDRAQDALARPRARSPRAWHALAWCWARVAWPMPCLGELGPCMVRFLVMSRCSWTKFY
jgi:hypothetical protein